MAPEYAMHGQFSVKSDVFSFGVLVLEMVTGQKNQCFRDGENIEDLLSFVSIERLAERDNVKYDRSHIEDGISFSLTLSMPSEPAFFMRSSVDPEMPLLQEYTSSTGSSGLEQFKMSKSRSRSSQYLVNDASISDVVPR
ncbi:hypothetical protein L6452_19649 [Arctium lappa]|uniref:Uncharacterized protein n=1 Tax=Arctium lappa TaxID=4217 RepID=A0ACB9BAI6_ARCLA|nr:hypothetical protein L6452_19649 [Arctium lappa]